MIKHSNSYLSIGAFSEAIGVSVVTIRRWCRCGKIAESFRTIGGHRRFSRALLRQLTGKVAKRVRIGYARVSSHDQKNDLATQSKRLSKVSDRVIEDLGSGLNCKKRGLKQLMLALLNREVDTLFLTHKDRLMRFGHELVFQVCRWAGTDVVVLDESKTVTFEEELCQDVLTLMTVFSARLYGSRSHKNKQLAA